MISLKVIANLVHNAAQSFHCTVFVLWSEANLDVSMEEKTGCRKPRRHVKSNPALRDGHRGGTMSSLKVIANLETLFTHWLFTCN
jgi:hypothetical protein